MLYSAPILRTPTTILNPPGSKAGLSVHKLRLKAAGSAGCRMRLGRVRRVCSRALWSDGHRVTLSREQAAFAAERAALAGLSGRVTIRCQDYPAIEKDAILTPSSVSECPSTSHAKPFGVFWQHLGSAQARRGLPKSCHWRGLQLSPEPRPSFIDEYVFRIRTFRNRIGSGFRRLAGFEVRDVENLREHYRLPCAIGSVGWNQPR